ncbi:RNA polymerase sigma factor [Thiofilum flexile]|uniref:RNA polymerase sigma factor n=1 Tax=Thiofilum flexile TaxID=125627 RepID=UPI0003A57928|nr:RNA polymerase sigma factor [Thiofilum flexile]
MPTLPESNQHECRSMLDAFVHQQGDCGAALLNTLQRYIRYCSTRLQPLSLEDQQEVMQEVCIKLLHPHQSLIDNCQGWLFTIVRNEYIDHLRRQQRINRVLVPDTDGNLVEVSEAAGYLQQPDHGNFYAEADCLEHIFDHIEQQPTGTEDIEIYTQYALGMSNQEIAAQTGRTAGAIAKRISLLKQKLKQLMSELC